MEAARPDTVVPVNVETSPDRRYAIGACRVRRVGFGATQLPERCVFGPPRAHGEALGVVRRAAELEENIACGAIRLTAEHLSRLDDC